MSLPWIAAFLVVAAVQDPVDEIKTSLDAGNARYLRGDYDGARTWLGAQAKIGVWQAKLDCLAGTKHVSYGQTRIGTALLTECVAVAPDSREGKQVKEILVGLSSR